MKCNFWTTSELSLSGGSLPSRGEQLFGDLGVFHRPLQGRRLSRHQEALASALMLSQTYGFVDGIFFAAEKLGRFQLLMSWCFARGDAKRLVEVCKRCGSMDQSLWVQALSWLAADEGDHIEEISEVLAHVESSELMPLLMVLETLQQSPSVTIGARCRAASTAARHGGASTVPQQYRQQHEQRDQQQHEHRSHFGSRTARRGVSYSRRARRQRENAAAGGRPRRPAPENMAAPARALPPCDAAGAAGGARLLGLRRQHFVCAVM